MQQGSATQAALNDPFDSPLSDSAPTPLRIPSRPSSRRVSKKSQSSDIRNRGTPKSGTGQPAAIEKVTVVLCRLRLP